MDHPRGYVHSRAVGWTIVECAGCNNPLPAGKKSRGKQMGRGSSRISGRITLTHANVLCQLGPVYPASGSSYFARSNLPGLDHPGGWPK